MNTKEQFKKEIDQAYNFEGESIVLGGAMLNGEAISNTLVKVPLKTLNRHGLIAGATGTGKTKTLQNFAEKLSEKGIPVLLMDVKGDLSGLSQAAAGHPKIDERHEQIGTPWTAQAFPCELLTISEQSGTRLRATLSEFGPVLLSKILGLNATQSGIVSIVFKYCDDHGLGLLDVKDFRKVLQFMSNEGKEEIEAEYGRVSASSVGAIMRSLITIEEQGADLFFGERSFDVDDLLRLDDSGKAYINILRIDDIQSKPQLFSTFMLCLLAEIFETFPEQGDADRPELVLFIDEAHLIFEEASDALLNQIEMVIKLIRSKGVGIFFVTQNPKDIPEDILSQLGMKVQHALRAFTAKDRRAIKQASENYPITNYYDTDELLTQLGIGEALVTVLDEKGRPSPLVHSLLTAPASRMDVISDQEKKKLIENSRIFHKYEQVIDRDSAYEILSKKMDVLEEENEKPKASRKTDKSTFEKIAGHTLTRTIARELTRGLLGVLGISSTRRRTRRRRPRRRY